MYDAAGAGVDICDDRSGSPNGKFTDGGIRTASGTCRLRSAVGESAIEIPRLE